jgi:hypothetical protein
MRYSTEQVPVYGAGAFMPQLTTNPGASSWGRVKITASLGTTAIPSPRPPAVNDSDLGGPYNQPSSVAPDVFFPTFHIIGTEHMEPPVAWIKPLHNELPVPAVNPGRVPMPAFHRYRQGGRGAIPWPRTFTTWPSVLPGYQTGT